MPAGPVDFRSRCGQFVFVYIGFMAKRARLARDMRYRYLRPRTRLEGLMVGLVLAIFLTSDLLLRGGNVETNPGPDGKDGGRTVQTRLTASGGRAASTSAVDRRTSASKTTLEPSMGDLMAKLMSMEAGIKENIDQVRTDVNEMRGEIVSLQKEVNDWKERVCELERENEELRGANDDLLQRVKRTEGLVDDLEGRSRRNNILVYGLAREEAETQRDLELRLNEVFTDKMDMTETIQFDRVHRLGSKANAPVIACCTYYRDKVSVLKAKQKLKGSDLFIGEDYSRGVREKRKKLAVFLKDIKQEDKTAKMVFDHLVVEGKKYFLSDDEKKLVER
jgi:FtsZ-binding cell division protein ZapB